MSSGILVIFLKHKLPIYCMFSHITLFFLLFIYFYYYNFFYSAYLGNFFYNFFFYSAYLGAAVSVMLQTLFV